jgi:hypothetical protein
MLDSLCKAARAISQAAEIHIKSVPYRANEWTCSIVVGSVTLIESKEGPLQAILEEVEELVLHMSATMRSCLVSGPGDPSDTGRG